MYTSRAEQIAPLTTASKASRHILPHPDQSFSMPSAAPSSQAPSRSSSAPNLIVDACNLNQFGDASSRISKACSCIAKPSIAHSGHDSTAACSVVSASWAAQISATPQATVDTQARVRRLHQLGAAQQDGRS
ncbi:hypothetical protein LX36DRAFT_659590 [Colletotrichum falcatum]|nr:hypothetical protein LX36DRAFT_659590 [Colletotrichum falcatum]